MKTSIYIRSLFIALIATFSVSIFVLAGGEKAPAAIAGKYVIDNTVAVPAGAYTTFSTVYEGKRYYLGIDTTRAKAIPAKDTVVWYDQPNYASMWVVGGLYNPRATSETDVLPDKNYQRAIESLWIRERCSRKKYLALGDAPTGVTYNTLILRDSSTATPNGNVAIWYTQKDNREQNKYIQGFLYYYSDASGVDFYRYLTFNPLYGFSRAYAARPEESQRISVWDRKTGNDVTCTMTPPTYTFDLNTTQDTLPLHITSHVYYYTNGDRFRSRYDQTDIYVRQPTVYDDQYGLTQEPYYMFGFYEWASNPRPTLPTTPEELVGQAYNGHSLMPIYLDSINHHLSPDPAAWTLDSYWYDSTVVWVSDTKYSLDKVKNLWHDTLFAIGKSPFDVLRKPADGSAPEEGDYVPHSDWLRQHYYIKNPATGVYEHFSDSILIVRRTFHTSQNTTLNPNVNPGDHVFPYIYDGKDKDGVAIGTRNTRLFTVTIPYSVENDTLYANGVIARSRIVDYLNLDIQHAKGQMIDGLWYDSLLIDYVYDAGTTTPCTWLTVDLNPARKDQIRVVAGDYNPEINANRIAEIHFTYRYSDGQVSSSRVIWITQRSKVNEEAGSSAEIYVFNHKDAGGNGLQNVHERKDNIYAIPEDNLNLPVNRDHWGYYRWFIYGGDYNDKDLENNGTWEYARKPENYREADFMPINPTTDPASRGQWDVIRDIHAGNDLFEPAATKEHFVVGSATSKPALKYPSATATTKSGKVACEVSAYYDIATSSLEGTPYVGKNLTSLTEPTLSYRQVFNIQPAKFSADKMKDYLYRGDEAGKNNNWMEEHQVIVPVGSAFSLQQAYPVRKGDASVDDANLSYVYYLNPTAAKEGTDDGFDAKDYTKSRRYNRVGVRKTVDDVYSLELLTPEQLNALGRNQSYDSLLLVNPNTQTGRLIGDNGNVIPAYRSMTGFSTEKELRDTLEARLNRGEIGSAYLLTFEHYYYDGWFSDEDYLRFTHNNKEWKNLFTLIGGGVWYYSLKWYSGGTGSAELTIAPYSGVDTYLPTGIPASTLMTIYTGYSSNRGYFKAENKEIWSNLLPVYPDNNTPSARHAWLVYKVTKESGSIHEETPRWEVSANGVSGWTEVARPGSTGDYRMLPTGELRIPKNVLTANNQILYYRLRTEHFQLAKFTVVARIGDGPATSAIITEDSIQNHFDIMFTMGNELLPAPGTSEVKAYNHHLPWSYSELSYHYPRSTIGDEYRVFRTDLPAEGEYAFLNKFSLNGHTTNAMAGAENGYMLCIHAAQKPLSIFDFTYPQLPCSDQQIYLTFDLANPLPGTGYQPQITAELQGKIGAGDWTPIHRFKTSELEFKGDDVWQQFVLEIPRASILGQDSFRCVATLTGSTVDNAYVLIDRLRFIAKERPMTVFQNKATCLESEAGGDVHLTARLDYKNLSDLSDKLVAFQYQKKVGANFVPLQTDAEAGGTSGAGDIDAYVNDISVTPHTDNTGKSCGVVRIPVASHVPCNGTTPCDSIVAVTAVTTKKKCYVNEGTDAKKYYVMYLSQQVHALVGDTFRVVMAVLPNAETHPNFATVGCAAVRTIPIDNPIEIHVNGAATVWPNMRRDELSAAGTPDSEDKLRPANATYSVTATINDDFLPSGALAGSGKCMFDVVRTAETDRNMDQDEWFKNRFGVTRAQFRELMTFFRADHPDNVMKLETNWNNVRAEYFMYDKRYTKPQADSVYAILNRLIVEKDLVEIGLSSYDVYLADNNNSYAVLWPIPASGTYVDAETHETRDITVCATPRWFEIHSDESDYNLRFGYDNLQPGNYYMTPVIRATAAEANSSLKVRIADITHTEHAGVVIGWDSTYVIDSNDPEWNPATKTFRYHQDRIVQDGIFDNYYKVPSKESTDPHRYVTFKPVDNTYITTELRATDCPCYNYDASKTKYKSGDVDDVLEQVSASGCNKWGVKYIAKGGETRTGTAAHNMPGYQVANNITLKAGYWYKFKTSFFDVSSVVYYNEGGDGTCRGNSEFILAIAPDKVQWTPSHPDGINYWNDDNNWTPVMASAPADGFKAKVPMGETQVIIPEMAAANTLPIVNNTVPRRIDTLDYGFKKNTCKDILFKPRATMLGQEMLDYERAFVDVPLATAEYMTFSPALKYIYAGDIYIPKVADNVDFDPKYFKDPSTSYSAAYNRKTPYAMYAAYYNQTVDWAYYNTDTEGNELSYKSRSSADWVFTNTMKMPLTPGTACLLLAYDKTGENKDSVIVRLPKKETAYPYIGKKPDGSWGTGAVETMEGKPAFGDLSNNLAFNKTDLATARTTAGSETAGITYTLNNQTPSKVFFFGNPTMALIDVYKLCQDNSSKLQKGGTGTSYYFTAYHLREGEASYSTRVITGPGQFFVAPQRSVGLIATSAGTELEVELRPEALVAMADGSAISIDTISFSAPARRAAYQEPSPINWLYMSAANETDGGLCKAYLTIGQSAEASRNYVAGEDALNLSSGTSNSVAYETPLSMYTIAGNEALMLDVRDSIGTIPLVFATLPDYEYEEYTLLSFAFEGHWSTPLYLYDALTNDSIQITNGLQVGVRTPQSDQIRYFINGSKRVTSEENQQGTATGIEEVNDQLPNTNYQSGTVIYDVLGRKIMTLNEYDLISNIHLPTGVYIIQRGSNTERMVIR